MVAVTCLVRNRREMFVAELTEAALEAVSRYGIRGSSIELEIDLWNQLESALGRLADASDHGCDHRVAELVRAAYVATLLHGIEGSFLDVELELWRSLRRVVRHNRFV